MKRQPPALGSRTTCFPPKNNLPFFGFATLPELPSPEDDTLGGNDSELEAALFGQSSAESSEESEATATRYASPSSPTSQVLRRSSNISELSLRKGPTLRHMLEERIASAPTVSRVDVGRDFRSTASEDICSDFSESPTESTTDAQPRQKKLKMEPFVLLQAAAAYLSTFVGLRPDDSDGSDPLSPTASDGGAVEAHDLEPGYKLRRAYIAKVEVAYRHRHREAIVARQLTGKLRAHSVARFSRGEREGNSFAALLRRPPKLVNTTLDDDEEGFVKVLYADGRRRTFMLSETKTGTLLLSEIEKLAVRRIVAPGESCTSSE